MSKKPVVYEYDGRGFEPIVEKIKIKLPNERHYTEISINDLAKNHPEAFEDYLSKAIESPKTRKVGRKTNKKGEHLDTKGNLYALTFDKGGEPAYIEETIYGTVFKEVKAPKKPEPKKPVTPPTS